MRHKKVRSSAEKLRTLDSDLGSVAPEPAPPPCRPPLCDAVHKEVWVVLGVRLAHRSAAEICPRVAKRLICPKFSFIKGPRAQRAASAWLCPEEV